jgi:hypothetical protein
MLLDDSSRVAQDRRDRLERRSIFEHLHGKRVAEHVRVTGDSRELEQLR